MWFSITGNSARRIMIEESLYWCNYQLYINCPINTCQLGIGPTFITMNTILRAIKGYVWPTLSYGAETCCLGCQSFVPLLRCGRRYDGYERQKLCSANYDMGLVWARSRWTTNRYRLVNIAYAAVWACGWATTHLWCGAGQCYFVSEECACKFCGCDWVDKYHMLRCEWASCEQLNRDNILQIVKQPCCKGTACV